MTPLKQQFVLSLLTLTFLTVAGCSPGNAPGPTTPTPLPVIVQAATAERTVEPDSNTDATKSGPTPETPAIVDNLLIEKEIVVDSLHLWIEHLFPVKARLTVGGYLSDNCFEISGWEQNLDGNTLFVRPVTKRMAGARCSDSRIRFEEDVYADVNGLSVSELSNGDYFLDANGFTMPLSPAFTGSLLDEELTGCPARDEGQILYFNEQAGFCLFFPDTFEMRDAEAPGVVGFYGPPLDSSMEPLQALLIVNYQDLANGRSLEDIATERIAGKGEILTATPTSIAGEPAILVEGQGERSKFLEIITTNDDHVFALTISPYDEAFPQAAGDVDLAWNLALNSFTFVWPPFALRSA